MYLSFLHCLFDRASGLVDMTASAETALSFTGREFREAVFQIFFLYISHIEELNPGRIHDIGDSPPSMISSECLVVCFPLSILRLMLPVSIFTPLWRRLIRDDLPTPDGPAMAVVVSPQEFFEPVDIFLFLRACKQERIPASLIYFF